MKGNIGKWAELCSLIHGHLEGDLMGGWNKDVVETDGRAIFNREACVIIDKAGAKCAVDIFNTNGRTAQVEGGINIIVSEHYLISAWGIVRLQEVADFKVHGHCSRGAIFVNIVVFDHRKVTTITNHGNALIGGQVILGIKIIPEHCHQVVGVGRVG